MMSRMRTRIVCLNPTPSKPSKGEEISLCRNESTVNNFLIKLRSIWAYLVRKVQFGVAMSCQSKRKKEEEKEEGGVKYLERGKMPRLYDSSQKHVR